MYRDQKGSNVQFKLTCVIAKQKASDTSCECQKEHEMLGG